MSLHSQAATEAAQGRGAGTESNPSLEELRMAHRSKTEVEVLAGLDIRSCEISVARFGSK